MAIAKRNPFSQHINVGPRTTPNLPIQLVNDLIDDINAALPSGPSNAVGDGVADDTAAWVTALALGTRLSGGGRTYAVSGNIVLPANTWIEDAEFKQLDPNVNGRRTLTSAGGDNITLRRVTVDRNGDGASGDLDGAGIWLIEGDSHLIEGCEVFGPNIGSGIVLVGCTRPTVRNNTVHHIEYNLPSDPGDDQVQGIWMVFCTDFLLEGNSLYELRGDFGAGPTLRYSRAYTFSGCERGRLIANEVDAVDQGFDITGGPETNDNFVLIGNIATNCYTYGFKFATSARHFIIIGCLARDCGLNCFIWAGENVFDHLVIGCSAYNAGNNGVWSGESGFAILFVVSAAAQARGIRLYDCLAVDDQVTETMVNGFYNEVAIADTAGTPNEAVNCHALRYTSKAFVGFHAPLVYLTRSAVQSIPDDTLTEVIWTTEVTDSMGMHVADTGRVDITQAGVYELTAQLSFDTNATGYREGRFTLGGSNLGAPSFLAPNTLAPNTINLAPYTGFFKAGDSLGCEAFQNSGGALNLNFFESFFSVKMVNPNGITD